MFTALLLLGLILGDDRFITYVREGYLDHNAHARIGLVFEHYKWFEAYTWEEQKGDDDQMVVTFRGTIDDVSAVTDFYENNKYAWRRAFKSMQLSSYYGLTEDKEKLRYTIHFKFTPEGVFRVDSGALEVKGKAKETWSSRTLDDRSLMALIEGIYSNENPYVSLVAGMPYK